DRDDEAPRSQCARRRGRPGRAAAQAVRYLCPPPSHPTNHDQLATRDPREATTLSSSMMVECFPADDAIQAQSARPLRSVARFESVIRITKRDEMKSPVKEQEAMNPTKGSRAMKHLPNVSLFTAVAVFTLA